MYFSPLQRFAVNVSLANRLLRKIFIFLACAVVSLSILSPARAVSPPPDGGYPNGNTAEGDNALFSLTSGADNTAIGNSALFSNTTGFRNTANGWQALYSNTTGFFNTANGYQALFSNKFGGYNTANGYAALFSNTTGSFNTANGWQALYSNTNGRGNTATGASALQDNTTGGSNTANGFFALGNNTTGNRNTANGSQALQLNTIGNNNTANGTNALFNNGTGSANTATGFNALVSNTTGEFNDASGYQALFSNTIGNHNTATGPNALLRNTTGLRNTANGAGSLNNNTTGSLNIAVGNNAGFNLTTGSNNIDIGAPGVAGESGKIRIGTSSTAGGTFIAGISGKTVASGVGVIVNASGQLGTVLSSARFKTAIKPMDRASEAILALQPVTFRYKQDLDPDGIPQFGLVAEQVEKVDPDLVIRDEEGKVMTVRYEAVNAMLLNEFLKEHQKVVNQETRLSAQEALIAQQQKQIEALTATVQKVSDQITLSKPAPQLVANP
jgi:hypothetical protein